jgi:MoaA/NifB/PqqE/SkfB family radical SAM enzyme
MRFPLRLSAALFRARHFSRFGGVVPPAIFHLSPLVTRCTERDCITESSPGLEWHSPDECVRLAQSGRSSVVWLSGADPLLHPDIGRITSLLVRSGRHVFLHTSGLAFRQRIHEFEPESRLFLTIELAGLESSHDRLVEQPGAFRRVIEGARAAKLSGFLVCAHVTVTHESDPAEIAELFEFLDAKDMDGFVVSSGGSVFSVPARAAMQAKLEELRALIRCGRWARFSQLLESSYTQPAPAPARPELREGEAKACEESV